MIPLGSEAQSGILILFAKIFMCNPLKKLHSQGPFFVGTCYEISGIALRNPLAVQSRFILG